MTKFPRRIDWPFWGAPLFLFACAAAVPFTLDTQAQEVTPPTVSMRGPKGDAGTNGKDGAAGAAGQTVVGPQGPAGKDGADGKAATVTVGAVATGAPGSAASVASAGTPAAAVLSFVIPRGADGAPGQSVAGPKGDKGDPGASIVGPAGPAGAAGASFALSAPAVVAFTAAEKNGTAWQPRASGPCIVAISATLTGVLNGTTFVTVGVSPTGTGTFTTVATFALLCPTLAGTDAATVTIPVPAGHFVKVTQTGVAILGSVSMARTVWSL